MCPNCKVEVESKFCPECGAKIEVMTELEVEDTGVDNIAEDNMVDGNNKAEACCHTAEDYYYGRNGNTQDYEEAVKWYRKAAEQGHAYAQYSLGWCYEHGEGVEESMDDAFNWYNEAAIQGYEDATMRLVELGFLDID